VLSLAHSVGVPVFILGSGSNIVVGDGGIRGLTIENKASGQIAPGGPMGRDGDRYLARAEAGASFAQ
jgi:UDP-N-acetylenolpyruvoylglucosamine reductase